jgi:DNA-binding response OmpR family regulator
MQKRLLVVEPDLATREMFVVVLEREGFEVITAVDGHDGIAQAISFRPNLIVTALNLPNIGGAEMIRKLRTETTFKDRPILAVTAYTDLVRDAIKAGANYVIVKPIPLRILLGHIAELLYEPEETVFHAGG